jgi:hypothetical protein
MKREVLFCCGEWNEPNTHQQETNEERKKRRRIFDNGINSISVGVEEEANERTDR